MVRAAHERTSSFYLGCIAWCALCWWLAKNGLGVIAFVASIFFAIWVFGLRDKFDGEQGSSAYSVFNAGGRAILGGFTGEQLENQMRGGFALRNSDTKHSTTTAGAAPLTTTGGGETRKALSEKDKTRRRSAAAAAAERRMKERQEQ
jgi:hypothetical protein